MNEQEQRIAIAEACGWSGCTDPMCEWRKADHLHKARDVGFPESFSTKRYPDYLHDLNAMHEAEGILSPADQMDFSYHLKELACPITGEDWMAIHATAAQRAEAFLRTIGKWKDTP